MLTAPFSQWPHLVLRTLVAETIGLQAETTPSPEIAAVMQRVPQALDLAVSNLSPTPDGHRIPGFAPLQQTVARGLSALRDALRILISDMGVLAVVDRQLKAATNLAQSRSCQSCSRDTGHCCDGKDDESDRRQAADPGLCLTPYLETFALFSAFAEGLYDRLASPSRPIAIQLAVWPTARPRPHGLFVNVATAGRCELEDQVDSGHLAASRLSTVIIDIYIKGVDWPTIASIPYVLTHELLCHAHQGCATGEIREPPAASCKFAEGWLDCVAHEALRDRIENWGIYGDLPCAVDVSSSWLHHGAVLHAARYDGSVDRHQLRFGKLCAEKMKYFIRLEALRRAPGCDLRWPERLARDFALALNAARSSSSEPLFSEVLNGLVRILTHLANPLVRPTASPARDEFWQAIVEFQASADLETLARSVTSIETLVQE